MRTPRPPCSVSLATSFLFSSSFFSVIRWETAVPVSGFMWIRIWIGFSLTIKRELDFVFHAEDAQHQFYIQQKHTYLQPIGLSWDICPSISRTGCTHWHSSYRLHMWNVLVWFGLFCFQIMITLQEFLIIKNKQNIICPCTRQVLLRLFSLKGNVWNLSRKYA